MAADSVSRTGGIVVAVITLAVVGAAAVFALGRDDMRSTPVEDVAAGRTATAATADPTDSDPGLAREDRRPQGRDAPDSREGVNGAGVETQTRGATDPDANPNASAEIATGRNAPRDPNDAAAQRVPRNDLDSGANADREESARIPR